MLPLRWHDVANVYVIDAPDTPVNHRRSDIPTPIVGVRPRRIGYTHDPRQHPCHFRRLYGRSDLLRAANDPPTSYEEFLDVLAGLRLSSSRIDIDIDRGQVTLDGRDAGLSAKEHDLLAHLAANADRSVTRDELFASVWADSELGSDSRTVDAHIRRLRKKLSILPDLISTVRGEGYRFNSTPSVRVRVTRPVTLAA